MATYHPDFYHISGGDKMRVKPYSDITTNGLTNAVYDWMKYSGHYVNRIHTTGVARKINGKLTYTHGTTNTGTADIDCIIDSKPVKIEIKCAATKDRVRPHQQAERARIEAAGGVYIIVSDMTSFIEWYNSFVNNKKIIIWD